MGCSLKFLATLFALSGLLHFIRPQTFEPIVPKQLPAKRELVYASGAAELVCSGLLIREQTRPTGGLLSVAVLAAVFPANVQMTASVLRSSRTPVWFKAGTVGRLPLQYPLIRIAMRAARGQR